MPIYNDLLTVTGADQSIPAPIESDFFTNGFDLPDTTPSAPKPRLQPQSPLKDWRLVVDRAFMRGLSAADILKGIGNEIAGHPEEAAIRAYLAKYEGLIGTVFVDSAVIAAGFPPPRFRAPTPLTTASPSTAAIPVRSPAGAPRAAFPGISMPSSTRWTG